MRTLNYDQAHNVVSSSRKFYWDGWDIVSWTPNPNGATNVRGLFRNGRWGIAQRYSVSPDGLWRIPNGR